MTARRPLTLEDLCGGSLPAGLAALSDDERRELLDTIRDARRRQAADLQEAAERGLELVPKLLRAPVKKAILG